MTYYTHTHTHTHTEGFLKTYSLWEECRRGKDQDQQMQTSMYRMDKQGTTVQYRELYSITYDKPQ